MVMVRIMTMVMTMVEHLDRILPVQQGLWQPVDICGRRQPGCGGPWPPIPERRRVLYKVSGVAKVHWDTASILLFQPGVVVKLQRFCLDYWRLFHLELSPFQK